jgi:hypothetical protein
VITVSRERKLADAIDAIGAASRFAGGLDCRQEQRDQNTYDCDDHEQFNERKTPGPRFR